MDIIGLKTQKGASDDSGAPWFCMIGKENFPILLRFYSAE